MTMNYILIFEDGEAFTSDKLPEHATTNIEQGALTVIRAVDLKELTPSGAWVAMNRIEDEG